MSKCVCTCVRVRACVWLLCLRILSNFFKISHENEIIWEIIWSQSDQIISFSLDI